MPDTALQPDTLLQIDTRDPSTHWPISIAPPGRPSGLIPYFLGLVLLVTAMDLLGWLLHIPALTSVLPNYATMKPNTALCLALLALAGITLSRLNPSRPNSRFAAIASILALTVSGLSLFEYATHTTLSLGSRTLDQLLIQVPADRFPDPTGRMSLGTALAITLTAAALFLLDRLPRLSTSLLLVGILISVSGLLGFLFGAGPLLAVPWLRSLAIHTASCLLLLQLAALASRPDREPFRSLVLHTQPIPQVGSRRHLLLAVTILPILVGLPILGAQHLGWFDGPFAVALLLVALLLLQTAILWTDNRALNNAQALVRLSEAGSARILQSIGDAVVVTDPELRVLRMNPIAESLTGWSLDEARNRPFPEIFKALDESTRQPRENPAAKVLRLKTIVGLANHTILIGKHGKEFAIDDSAAPIHNDDGALLGIVIVFRSVSGRRQAEQALLQSEKLAAVGRLAASIAHEINNPLASVTNLLFLARLSQDPLEIGNYLELADRELGRVANISNQTLRFYKQAAHPVSVPAAELIDSVLTFYKTRIVQSRIELRKRYRAETPITCFEGEIRQVLNNLIGNAIDAMHPQGGHLHIRNRVARHWPTNRQGILLTIADTGAGIEPSALKQVFEPFFTTKGNEGNGLGLWVSSDIVRRHNGVMRLRSSQRKNRCGTVFSLFLPFEAASR